MSYWVLSDWDDKNLQRKGRTNCFGFRAMLLACWTVEIANDQMIFLEHLKNEGHTEEINGQTRKNNLWQKSRKIRLNARNTAWKVRYVRKEWSFERKGDCTQTNKSRNLGRYDYSLIMNVERDEEGERFNPFLPADLTPTLTTMAIVSWAGQGGKPEFLQGLGVEQLELSFSQVSLG